MFMKWQRGDLEDITLEVPDCEEEELDDDGEPIVRYESEEEYELYVIQESAVYQKTIIMFLPGVSGK